MNSNARCKYNICCVYNYRERKMVVVYRIRIRWFYHAGVDGRQATIHTYTNTHTWRTYCDGGVRGIYHSVLHPLRNTHITEHGTSNEPGPSVTPNAYILSTHIFICSGRWVSESNTPTKSINGMPFYRFVWTAISCGGWIVLVGIYADETWKQIKYSKLPFVFTMTRTNDFYMPKIGWARLSPSVE